MHRRLFLLAAVGAWPALAQSEAPQRLVKLNVAAIDAKGDPVTDLKANEVFVLEDGRPRHIDFFRFAGSKRLVAPPGPGEFTARPAPPATVILLDRWNERLMTTAMASIQLNHAIQNLETAGGVYLYVLTNHGGLYPVYGIPGTQAEARAQTEPSPAQLATLLDVAVRKLQGFRDIDQHDPIYRFNLTFEALTALGTQMTAISGRKSLIWVTHGVPLGAVVPNSNDWADFTPQVTQMGMAAAQAGIAIYTVDESGSGAGATPDLSRAMLQSISGMTGGRWYPSDDIDRAAAGARTDAHGNYIVAYHTPILEKDKKYHKIRFDSSRKGILFKTRDGYPGDTPEPQADALEEAIVSAARRSPFDASEIGIRVAVTAGSKINSTHFQIHVDLADLLLVTRDNHYRGQLAVVLAAYTDGFLNGSVSKLGVDINFTEDQFQHAVKDGLVVPQDMKIPDQVQKVRVIVYDRGLRSVGSVTVPVTRP